jgi:hypothetical protein
MKLRRASSDLVLRRSIHIKVLKNSRYRSACL